MSKWYSFDQNYSCPIIRLGIIYHLAGMLDWSVQHRFINEEIRIEFHREQKCYDECLESSALIHQDIGYKLAYDLSFLETYKIKIKNY